MRLQYFLSQLDVDQSIIIGETVESLYLDFKESVNGFNSQMSKEATDRARKELCRDVTQFANHLGGCLLVGIAEIKNTNNLKVASRYQSVQDPDKLREWIELSIDNYCIPKTFRREVAIIDCNGNILLAVNVPPSRIPVVLWDRQNHTMEVIGRNNHGKVYLNPDDLERLRMNGARAAKIAIDSALSKADVSNPDPHIVLVSGFLQWSDANGKWFRVEKVPNITIKNREDDAFDLEFEGSGYMDRIVTLPYGLVQECWNDKNGRVHMLLSVDIGSTIQGALTIITR